MIRLALLALSLLLVPQPGPPQVTGTVLIGDDVTSGHLLSRPVTVEGRDWLGLGVSGDTSWIAPVDVAWTAAVDFGDSIFTLSVEPMTPLMLLADVPGVRVGSATTLEIGATLWTEDPLLEVTLASRRYSLELRGTPPALCDAGVTLSDGETSQELYVPDYDFLSCDEPHFTVDWAGDLDGDGRLDLVTTFSQKYSFYPRRLFLSSAAPDGALVGLVAVFDGTAA